MKIAVTLTVEISAKNWTGAFGVEGATAIREDVRTYVHGLVAGAEVFHNGEIAGQVTLKESK
jgi:hypothetical protein